MDIQHILYEKLIAFAVGELDPNEARVVAMHTASCAKCSRTVTHFESIRRWMRADDSIEPPLVVRERAYAIFPHAAALPQHAPESVLVGFATDTLEPEYAKTLETHINSCTECSKTVAHIRSIRLWFRQDDSQDPPLATLTRAYSILHNQRRGAIPLWRQVFSLIMFPTARRFAIALMLVVITLSTFLAYTTTGNLVSTAHAAIPGDSLYLVKQQFEQIELVTTWDTAGKLDKHIVFAGHRVDETVALLNLQRQDEVPTTIAAFETETNLVVQTYNILAKENVSRARVFGIPVQTAFASYLDKLTNLRGGANEVVTPLIDHAIATAGRNQETVHEVYNQLLTPPNTPVFATLTPTGVTRPATRIVPSLTSIPRSEATATAELAPQNTPTKITPTDIPIFVRTATPTIGVPTATRTSTPVMPTATRTPLVLPPTATQTLVPPVLTATQTPLAPAPTATQTPPFFAPTTTQTPPVLAPTATQTPPVPAPTATQTVPAFEPTATQTPIPPMPIVTQTSIPSVPTASGIKITPP